VKCTILNTALLSLLWRREPSSWEW